MTELIIELPWPPSVNTYWRSIGPGRVIISKKGREYRESAIKNCAHIDTLLTGRLSVKIEAYPPDARKRDLDNLPKAILDALTHADVWLDDSQIDDLQIVRREKVENGSITVIINNIESKSC